MSGCRPRLVELMKRESGRICVLTSAEDNVSKRKWDEDEERGFCGESSQLKRARRVVTLSL